MSDSKANLKPFPKGISGNPGGRTKADLEVEAFAKLNAKLAITTLVNEMTGALLSSDRIRAANIVLERAYGKAKEHITVKNERDLSKLTDTELKDAIIADLAEAGMVASNTGKVVTH